MFQLTAEEKMEAVTNCDHLSRLRFSPVLPYAFTEHGVLMLANILNSDRAARVSVQLSVPWYDCEKHCPPMLIWPEKSPRWKRSMMLSSKWFLTPCGP